jgi:Ni/Co efflux regulator RcnB
MTKVQKNIDNPKSIRDLTGYQFKSRKKNPEWSVEKLIPLRSCLIHNKASQLSVEKMTENFLDEMEKLTGVRGECYISTIPKWLTTLEKPECLDTGTGEIIFSDYLTDDFKASRNRKIKTINKFCNFYEPLYQARKVSLLFHTFTRNDYAKKDMRTMIECAKKRYYALNRPIRGYLWVMELEENEKMDSGFHIHYHLVVAINRFQVREIPEELKFQDLWGQRTSVEFIIKTIKGYLSKYLSKSNVKVLGRHHYAISRSLK